MKRAVEAPSEERSLKRGSPGRTRTCNLVVNSHLLHRLSYRGLSRILSHFPAPLQRLGQGHLIGVLEIPPVGRPRAMRVMRTPSGLRSRAR